MLNIKNNFIKIKNMYILLIKFFYIFLLFLIYVYISFLLLKKNNQLKIEFDIPAKMWEETFPLGNGRLGAMPNGGITKETIYLNEETIWSGSEWDPYNPDAKKWLPKIRQKLLEGDNIKAEELTFKYFICSQNGSYNPKYGTFQTLGTLDIDFSEMNFTEKDIYGYNRFLSLNDAISKTVFNFKYKGKKDEFTREYFTSLTDNIIVIYLKTKFSPLKFSFTLNRTERVKVINNNSISTMKGMLNSGDKKKEGLRFFTEAKIIKKTENEAIIFISASSDYKEIIENKEHKNFNKIINEVENYISKASVHSYDELKNSHINEYKKYFDRVFVEIGKTDILGNIIPIDNSTRYLQFGRYLFICSSFNSKLPPNLQGIWSKSINTPWFGDFHLNINIEMNHWPMEPGNLADLSETITKFVEDLVPSGEKTAKDFYGTTGWSAHVLANAWHFTAPSQKPSWGASFTGGAWISLQLWEHFLFNKDENYLKRIYPILKGAAEFLRANLFNFTNGYLVTGPSCSPENSFIEKGKKLSICAGPYMDTQITKEIFSAVIKSSEILKVDLDYAKILIETSKKLPPMKISSKGYLQEWLEDYEESDMKHRHVSHLFGLYPGTTINSKELLEAAKKTLERRGDEGTGWSRAWKINFWARLGDGNHAYKIFKNLMNPVTPNENSTRIGLDPSLGGTFPNMFCSHPPFQIDGNFGGSAGLMEMLLQSHIVEEDGTRIIKILPAIPDIWESGSFKGLKARGGITVNCTWKNGKITNLNIENPKNEKIKIIKCK